MLPTLNFQISVTWAAAWRIQLTGGFYQHRLVSLSTSLVNSTPRSGDDAEPRQSDSTTSSLFVMRGSRHGKALLTIEMQINDLRVSGLVSKKDFIAFFFSLSSPLLVSPAISFPKTNGIIKTSWCLTRQPHTYTLNTIATSPAADNADQNVDDSSFQSAHCGQRTKCASR